MGRILDPGRVFEDRAGNLLSGGTATFYTSGTATLKATYSDAALTVQNSNPVTIGSDGRLPVEVFGTGIYTIRASDSNGSLAWQEDDVRAQNEADADDITYNQGGSGAVDRTQESKNQESVSVKDFGAVGDGSTDDTGAIQRALDSGSGVVLLPPGSYRTTSTLVVNDPGAGLLGAGLSGGGGLQADAISTIFVDHIVGPGIQLTDENQSIRSLTIDGSSTRNDDGAITDYGILLEPSDTSSDGCRGCMVENVAVRDHPGHAIVTSGTVYMTQFDHVTLRNIGGHGWYLDDGTLTSRTNKTRPGQIVISNCRGFQVSGHQIRAGNTDTFGAFRLFITNYETSGYVTGFYDNTLFLEDATFWLYGENIVVTGCAVSGAVDGTETLSGMWIGGRNNRLITNRFITVDPYAVIVGQEATTSRDNLIDGMLISQDVTLNPAVFIETGALGTTVISRNTDQITSLVGGDTTDVLSVSENGFRFAQNISAGSFDVNGSTAQAAYGATRADAAVGAVFTRTGTGAAVASFLASGDGATVTDGNVTLTVGPTSAKITTLPTSSSGLTAGELWNDAGTVKVV